MKKYKYSFATEEVEISISIDWEKILSEMDREEYNIDHKETRRKVSMDDLYEGEWFASSKDDPFEMIEERICREKMEERLKLITESLTDEQKELIFQYGILKKAVGKIAEEENVSQSAISWRLSRLRKKIEKLLKRPS